MRINKYCLLTIAFLFTLCTETFANITGLSYDLAYNPTYENSDYSISSGEKLFVGSCDVSVSLRSKPSKDAPVITQVPLFEGVTFLGDVGNGFFYVNYKGDNGYILNQYLDIYEPEISIDSTGWITNVDEYASLRSLPSTSASVVAKIPKGAMVTNICYINDNFYRVTYNGTEGYVLKSLVTTNYERNNSSNDNISSTKSYNNSSNGQTQTINGLTITLESAELSYANYTDLGGLNYWYWKPDPGKVFVICHFNIVNNSNTDKFISSYNFDGYADNYKVDKVSVLMFEFFDELNADIAAGKMAKGDVCFECPDNFNKLEVKASSWGDEAWFNIYRN